MSGIPYDEQIERAVLCAIQRRGQLFEVATAAGINRESFHVPELVKVFDAMSGTVAAGEKIDVFLLLKRLPGYDVFLAELDGTISTDTNFREWLSSLRQFEALRRMQTGARELLQGIESGTDAAGAVAALAGLEEAARRMIAGRQVSTLPETAAALLARLRNTAGLQVIPFFSAGTEGAAVLQLHPGEMMVIGARTGYGKTAFACGGVLEQLRAGLVVLYFCTESSSADILARLAAQQSGVSHFEAGRRRPDPAKVDRLAAAVEEINRQHRKRLFIHGDECGLITPEIMRGRCREVETEAGRVDVVIVDFLQGLHAPDFMNRKTSLEQTNYNVQALHAMLAEFQAAGVILAQFNRTGQTDRSGNGMPDITWLKKKTSELKDQYAAARKEADKFADRLDKSAAAADEAKAKYGALKEKLAGMPEPVKQTGDEMKKLTPQMRSLSRGISGLSALLGGTIPGVSGLTGSISLLSLATGPAGIALAAAGATAAAGIGIYRIYSNTVSDAAKVSAQLAEESAKNTETFKAQAESNRTALSRLQELSGFESLNDYQKEESRKLVNQLSAAYKGLGLVYDEVTGKVHGLTNAQANLSDLEKKSLQDKLKEQYQAANVATRMATREAGHSVSFGRSSWEWAPAIDTRLRGGEYTTTREEALGFSRVLDTLNLDEKIKRVSERVKELGNAAANGNASAWAKQAASQLPYWQKVFDIAKREKDIRDDILKKARDANRPHADKNLNNQFETTDAAYVRDVEGNLLRKKTEEEIAAQRERNIDIQMKIFNTAKAGSEESIRAELELDRLQRDRLDYEERKQREIASLKQSLVNTDKQYVRDQSGSLLRQKNNAEMEAQYAKDIREAQLKLAQFQSNTFARRDATTQDLANWGRRHNPDTGLMNGDQKQSGWRGVIPLDNGTSMTEVSAGARINGRETEIPLIIPTSTEDDLKRIAKVAMGGAIPDSLLDKAVSFAKKRLSEGKSPFYNGDQSDESLRRVNTKDSHDESLLRARQELDQLQAEQLKREEQSRQAMLQDVERMSGSLTRMRETAQTAITANSAEGIRLQSRATMSGQDYQKATAENSKATVTGIEGMKSLLEQLYTNGTEISTKLNNISTGTV